jgi:DNA-binding IscR family transcriptional regulator
MLAAEAVWREALQSQTLADLVEDGETMIDPANAQAVADFVEKSQR